MWLNNYNKLIKANLIRIKYINKLILHGDKNKSNVFLIKEIFKSKIIFSPLHEYEVYTQQRMYSYVTMYKEVFSWFVNHWLYCKIMVISSVLCLYLFILICNC